MVRKGRSCVSRPSFAILALILSLDLACSSAAFGQAMTEFGGMGALRAGAMGTGAGLSAGMGNDQVRRSYGLMMDAQQKAMGAAKGAIAEQTKAIQQYWNYGVQAEAQKKWAAAEQAYKYALQTISARDGQKSTTNVPVLERLVSTSKAEKKMDQAIDFQKMIVNLFQGEKKPDYKSVVKSRQELSNLFVQKQDYKSAEPILRDTMAMCDANHNVGNEQRSVILRLYGSVLRKLNKNAEADKLEMQTKSPVSIPAQANQAPQNQIPASQPVTTSAPYSQTQVEAPVISAPRQEPTYSAPTAVQQTVPGEVDRSVQQTIRHGHEEQGSASAASPGAPVSSGQMQSKQMQSKQIQSGQTQGQATQETPEKNAQVKAKEVAPPPQDAKVVQEPAATEKTAETSKESTSESKTEAKTEGSPAEKTVTTETTTLEKTSSQETAKQTTIPEAQLKEQASKESTSETTSTQETIKESAKQSTTEEKLATPETEKQAPQAEAKQATTSESESTTTTSNSTNTTKEEVGKTSTTTDSAQSSETTKTTTEKATTPETSTQSTSVETKTESQSTSVTTETSKTPDVPPANTETPKSTDK